MVGDVPHDDERSVDHIAIKQGHTRDGQTHIETRFDLVTLRLAGVVRLLDEVTTNTDLFKTRADDRGQEPHAVHGVHGIGRRELDAAVFIKHQRTITDAGRELVPNVVFEGELTTRDHQRKTLERVDVHPLKLTRTAANRQWGFTAENRYGLTIEDDGHTLHTSTLTPTENNVFGLHDLVPAPRTSDHRTFELVDHSTDEHVEVEGLRGGGAGLTQHHETGIVAAGQWRKQQEICETQVRQHSP
jgi:hypothetical protein